MCFVVLFWHVAVAVYFYPSPTAALSLPEGAYWLYLGSDEIEASSGTSGRCTGNLFKDNYVEGSARGVYMSETRDNMITSNSFIDTDENEFEDSDGLLWTVSGLIPFWPVPWWQDCARLGGMMVLTT